MVTYGSLEPVLSLAWRPWALTTDRTHKTEWLSVLRNNNKHLLSLIFEIILHIKTQGITHMVPSNPRPVTHEQRNKWFSKILSSMQQEKTYFLKVVKTGEIYSLSESDKL